MKMNFDEFREAAMAGGAEAAEAAAETAEEAGEAITESVVSNKPRMSVDMGPDGTAVSIDAPIEDMSFEEAVEFAQSMQSPDLSEQLMELAKEPAIQRAAKILWYGTPENRPDAKQVEATVNNPVGELEMPKETAADGGELNDENIYEITPEGFVAILESQLEQFIEMYSPNITLDVALSQIQDNREKVVEQTGALLEELDKNYDG